MGVTDPSPGMSTPTIMTTPATPACAGRECHDYRHHGSAEQLPTRARYLPRIMSGGSLYECELPPNYPQAH